MFFLMGILCANTETLLSQILPYLPYKNPAIPIEDRVNDLLSKMSLEEKFYQLFMIAHDERFDTARYQNGIFGIEISIQGMDDQPGQQMLNYNETWTARKQVEEINRIQRFLVEKTRWGIPGIFFGEALHGVVGKDGVAYPQSIALAASWDRDLMRRVCEAIALESQQRGWRQVLSPVINVATDVRWGRVEETYGEDPYLNAVMGSIFVRAFETKGIITTPKHFVANVGDGGRDSYPVHLDSMALANIYYPPFKACVDAGCRSIMTSYNSLNGKPCSMNAPLLRKTLKSDWGFNGFVISDAGAVGGANVLHNTSRSYDDSGKQAIESGMDVIFQTSIQHDDLFKKPFVNGEVDSAALDEAVARVLRAKFELGLFENPYATYFDTNKEEFQQLALESAEKSMVLLKNQDHTLPIDIKGMKILVVGADAKECRLGGYSGSGYQKVSVLDAIQTQWGKELAALEYVPGPGREEFNPFEVVPASNLHALEVELYNGANVASPKVKDLSWTKIDFHYTFYSPDESVKKDDFGLVMDGEWESPITGEVELGLQGNDGFLMWIKDKLVIDRLEKVGYHRDFATIKVEKGQRIPVHIEFYESYGNGELQMIWREKKAPLNELNLAMKKAMKADMILFVGGIEEGEFQDRSSLNLPGEQERWINELASLEPPMVVALVGGSAIEMPWIEKVEAVIDMWYGGEQQGNALVNILSGKTNPSGKLPITFPMNEGQLPLSYWHEPTGRGDDYIDGTGWPMFPFGFGLSYNEYHYGGISFDNLDKDVIVVPITNKGLLKGEEVVQLYAQTRYSQSLQPIIRLIDFQRVSLKPGETKWVRFDVRESKRRYQLYSAHPDQVVWAVGSSSRDLKNKMPVR
jgi:beta-glucosidase